MNAKTQNLMSQLVTIDCSFARCWDANATTALEHAIATAPTATGRALTLTVKQFNLTGRQGSVLENLLKFDQGREARAALHILSDGQIKEVA